MTPGVQNERKPSSFCSNELLTPTDLKEDSCLSCLHFKVVSTCLHMGTDYVIGRHETPDQILIKFGQNSDRTRGEMLRLKILATFGKIAPMSEIAGNTEVVPKVSLELHLRGDPPALETIKYSNSAQRSDTASGLQQRSVNKAVAVALTLLAANESGRKLTLFRIHDPQRRPSFVRAILSAKHEPQGRSQIRDLAQGLFLQLFVKPASRTRSLAS